MIDHRRQTEIATTTTTSARFVASVPPPHPVSVVTATSLHYPIDSLPCLTHVSSARLQCARIHLLISALLAYLNSLHTPLFLTYLLPYLSTWPPHCGLDWVQGLKDEESSQDNHLACDSARYSSTLWHFSPRQTQQ